MENVPPFIVITVLLGLALGFLNLFGIKINANDLKKFISIRGRTIAWKAYLLIATLISIYFLAVLSILFSPTTFSIGLATLTIVVLWALLGIWAPALQRLRSSRINTAINIVAICLSILMVVGFWIVQWPEMQLPIFVTLLLLAITIIYIVDRIVKKRKSSRNED